MGDLWRADGLLLFQAFFATRAAFSAGPPLLVGLAEWFPLESFEWFGFPQGGEHRSYSDGETEACPSDQRNRSREPSAVELFPGMHH